ncbi:MAG: hypothetical protein Q8K60_09000 [Parachlamydiaceae bacterium]|nr:hypothetical protein [Parachlamydiaceae bacterium]
MLTIKNVYRSVLFLALLISVPIDVYSSDIGKRFKKNHKCESDSADKFIIKNIKKHKKLLYYLYIEDFINSFIAIPTSNVSGDSSTISSSYLAGRASIYNRQNQRVGTCSASFLCMQNAEGIYTDISNYLSVDNGLIVSWFTPTKLINLELDSILHSMVTECIVMASTKIGFNPFYGKMFNMIVSSDDQKIYFQLTKI